MNDDAKRNKKRKSYEKPTATLLNPPEVKAKLRRLANQGSPEAKEMLRRIFNEEMIGQNELKNKKRSA